MGCKGGVLPLVKEKERCLCIKPYEQSIDIEQRRITNTTRCGDDQSRVSASILFWSRHCAKFAQSRKFDCLGLGRCACTPGTRRCQASLREHRQRHPKVHFAAVWVTSRRHVCLSVACSLRQKPVASQLAPAL